MGSGEWGVGIREWGEGHYAGYQSHCALFSEIGLTFNMKSFIVET